MTGRINRILKQKKLTASMFADQVGIQRSSVSHIMSGRNKPSLDLVQKILSTFPDISPAWLISGNGPMYLQEAGQTYPASMHVENEDQAKGVGYADGEGLEPGEESDIPADNHLRHANTGDTGVQGKRPQRRVKKQQQALRGSSIEKIVVFYSDGTFREYMENL